MSTPAYLETFENLVDVIEHTGGIIDLEPGIMTAFNLKNGRTANEILTAAKKSVTKDQYLGTAFILGADRNQVRRRSRKLLPTGAQRPSGHPGSGLQSPV